MANQAWIDRWGWAAAAVLLLFAPASQAQEAVLSEAVQAVSPTAETAAAIRQGYVRLLADRPLADFPIGVFDSGTGGLTVLEQILTLDAHQNGTARPGSDGKPDFVDESFVFLADQANMPYGNYPAVGKTRLLERLIVADARFLMAASAAPPGEPPAGDVEKEPAKAVVIACNTATAYGKDDIASFIKEVGVDVELVGVIDAGAKDAVACFTDGKEGTVGVLATQGTVLSGAYRAAIREVAKRRGLAGKVAVVEQGAFGLAGAIDGSPEFIDRGVTDRAPRRAYRGPSLDHPQAPIAPELLVRYAFDFSGCGVLYRGDAKAPVVLQLNSVRNYIAYHVVTLMETLRRREGAKPLRVVILGCTHFPFYRDVFRSELARLYGYREGGCYVYRHLMAPHVQIVDPARSTANELYGLLATRSKLRAARSWTGTGHRAQFYISVPNRDDPRVVLNPQGWFTYDYKYGRRLPWDGSDIWYVPFRPAIVGPQVVDRLARRVPVVWRLLARPPAPPE